jgi:hypothetical protein
MQVPFAIVHHANQYLITDGYENRHGLRATLGSVESRAGLAWILELHRIYNIPANLHFSGTLLEAIAWHQPEFITKLREMYQRGLLEIVGSCYGQNIMRFFSYEHNLRQLNEELFLYRIHLGMDPREVKVFWPPERVWDTARMAAVLNDPRLENRGYRYLLVDDRLLLPVDGHHSPRRCYDREQRWDPQLFQTYRVESGDGLIAVPIAFNLRQNIPPSGEPQFECLGKLLRWLSTLEPASCTGDVIAVYGDDMEKAAGLGAWDKRAPVQYDAFLAWISENPWIKPVRLSEWGSSSRAAGSRPIEVGTFLELANHFSAGEGYERWYFDPQWDRYRQYFSWAASRVNELSLSGADAALIELAEKHLMASTWESAWHTPPEGPFGNSEACGHVSPWIKAVASHSRHAAVIAEAAYWMRHGNGAAHALSYDIDSDGEDEIILKNDRLFAVFSPRWGGRLVALFSLHGKEGKMVIGNPSDDWNWMEELNRYMEIPPNHPGALTDVGFEHDIHQAEIITADGQSARANLCNKQPRSSAWGLTKSICLTQGDSTLRVDYTLPENLRAITLELGISPDYLNLLRHGRSLLRKTEEQDVTTWSAGETAVWIKVEDADPWQWSMSHHNEVAHVSTCRLAVSQRQFRLSIGVAR